MTRRIRPVLLCAALLLTALALVPGAQAVECEDGDVEWMDLGTCCYGFYWEYPASLKLHGMRCIGGTWTMTSAYKCPPEPCS